MESGVRGQKTEVVEVNEMEEMETATFDITDHRMKYNEVCIG
jgi:hypothetical protein